MKSMQNIQRLTGTGGCSKYVCKYIGKIDEQNYVIVEVNGEGQLMTKAHHLHNTKVTSSKIAEDKDRKKNDGKTQGRTIAHTQMLHAILRYPEVITNLIFAAITTMPLELRAGIKVDSDMVDVLEDGAFIGSAVDSFRRALGDMDEWRQHSANQVLILDDLKLSKISVDKITQFSLRPPEFLKVFDKVGDYFRWFTISETKIKVDMLPDKIVNVLSESCWIDGLQRQIRVRKKAMAEILQWCDKIQQDGGNRFNVDMISLFLRINRVLTSENEANLSEEEIEFREFMHQNLLHQDEKEEHLPIPIYSYLKPTMGVSFILHIMLSMG